MIRLALTIDLFLLLSQLFLLPLYDFTHFLQIVCASDKPNLLEAPASDFEVVLVVLVGLGQVFNLLKQDLRDRLHVVGRSVLANCEERVSNRLRLAVPTQVRDGRLEGSSVERRLKGLTALSVLKKWVHHGRHLHVLLLAEAEDFALGRYHQSDFLRCLHARERLRALPKRPLVATVTQSDVRGVGSKRGFSHVCRRSSVYLVSLRKEVLLGDLLNDGFVEGL